MPAIIRSFQGRYSALSPLFECGFFFEGDQYQSAAAAFEAAKIQNRADRVSFFAWNIKPWDARRRGKAIPHSWLRTDFDKIEFNVMLQIQREKFKWQEPEKVLLSTVGSQLIYGNLVHDNHWGVCSCQQTPDRKRKYGIGRNCSGTGENLLGLILMQVRNELLTSALPLAS